MFEVIRF